MMTCKPILLVKFHTVQFYTIVVLEILYFRLKLNIFQVVRVKKKSYDSSI